MMPHRSTSETRRRLSPLFNWVITIMPLSLLNEVPKFVWKTLWSREKFSLLFSNSHCLIFSRKKGKPGSMPTKNGDSFYV